MPKSYDPQTADVLARIRAEQIAAPDLAWRAKVDSTGPASQGLRIVGQWIVGKHAEADTESLVLARNIGMDDRNDPEQVNAVDKTLAEAGWKRVTEWLAGGNYYIAAVRLVDADKGV